MLYYGRAGTDEGSFDFLSMDVHNPLTHHSTTHLSASIIVRIPHAGCHSSGWKLLIDRQIFLFVSNLPFGVNNMMLGGENGQLSGSIIRPWYIPFSNSVSRGPLTVKCHSNKSSSMGAQCQNFEGLELISFNSREMRFTACEPPIDIFPIEKFSYSDLLVLLFVTMFIKIKS